MTGCVTLKHSVSFNEIVRLGGLVPSDRLTGSNPLDEKDRIRGELAPIEISTGQHGDYTSKWFAEP
jgi:hypothetical protein